MELSADALGHVCRWLPIEHMGRLARSTHRHAPVIRAAQDAWLHRVVCRYVDAGRRLVALGIVPAERLERMWARGAWIFEQCWRLRLPLVVCDGAPWEARSLGRLARRGGEPRRSTKLAIYTGTVVDCDDVVTQMWCDVDSAVDDWLSAQPSIETLSLANSAVYTMLLRANQFADARPIAETMLHTYMPALIAAHPDRLHSISAVFYYARSNYFKIV